MEAKQPQVLILLTPTQAPVSPALLERMALAYDNRWLNRPRPARKYHD